MFYRLNRQHLRGFERNTCNYGGDTAFSESNTRYAKLIAYLAADVFDGIVVVSHPFCIISSKSVCTGHTVSSMYTASSILTAFLRPKSGYGGCT